MSVFDPKTFADPPQIYRPLKIVHGLDHYLGEDGESVGLADDDPETEERTCPRCRSNSVRILKEDKKD